MSDADYTPGDRLKDEALAVLFEILRDDDGDSYEPARVASEIISGFGTRYVDTAMTAERHLERQAETLAEIRDLLRRIAARLDADPRTAGDWPPP